MQERKHNTSINTKCLDLSFLTLKDDHIPTIIGFLQQHKDITELDLRFNEITSAGAGQLAKLTTINTLLLGNNKIANAGADLLAANTFFTKLDVSSNMIDYAGVIGFAKNNTLKMLDLSSNDIGYKAIKSLVMNNTLVALKLSHNRILDAGAKLLAGSPTLIALDVSDCGLSEAASNDFALSKSITKLKISGNNKIDIACIRKFLERRKFTALNVSCDNLNARDLHAMNDEELSLMMNLSWHASVEEWFSQSLYERKLTEEEKRMRAECKEMLKSPVISAQSEAPFNSQVISAYAGIPLGGISLRK